MSTETQAAEAVDPREIFISYAMADRALADRLARSLQSAGQQVWVDSEDIRYADDWREAVFPAIEKAPAVVFVTSSASLASANCRAELEHAALLGKRIIPVVAERVDELPEVLEQRVRRDFRDPSSFDDELLRLLSDITSDPEYVDAHTHLAYRAARWRSGDAGVLGAKELRRAEAWLARAADDDLEPRPAELIVEFIQASRAAVRSRRLRSVAAAVVMIGVLVGGYLGLQWWLGIPRSGIELQLAGADPSVAARVAAGVGRLRQALEASVPDKRDRGRLLIATWNIRDLGQRPRPDEALHYIAEIVSHFDVVAIQEVKNDLADFDRIRQILGRGWQSLESDINEGRQGGLERLAFLFDTRKVTVGRLIGELDLAVEPDPTGAPYRSPYFVSFQFAGVEVAFCNLHLRWGSEVAHRPIVMEAVAAELARKVARGRDFPANLVLLGDVQGGSAGGRILEAIERAGFAIPAALRDLPTTPLASRGHPYDQIALLLSADAPLQPGAGGAIDFSELVYRDDEAGVYAAETVGAPGGDYDMARSYWMSDHAPKWLELRAHPARSQ